MSSAPNILQNLELRKNCTNLRVSTPPRTVSSSRWPCARRTCLHRDRHRQSWRNTHQKPTKPWDFAWHLPWGPPPLGIGWRCISNACPFAQCAGKMRTAGHGRSLPPPTPYLAKTDPESIATAADETGREMLSLGSLPRPYHALLHEVVPVASRESHGFLPILFPMVFFGGLLSQ